MLNSVAIARPFRVSEMYRDPCRVVDARPKVVKFLDRVRDQNANPTSPLNRYIEGWAQTDLEKILDATAPSYRFTDPFVGSFDVRSLHKYFDLLQDRLSCMAISRRELAFFLQGPMKLRSHKELQFWREAPRIGLTGVAEIEIGERGVATERVAYDLNLASDLLCRARRGHASGTDLTHTEDLVQHEQATLRHYPEELPPSAQNPRRARRGAGIWRSSVGLLLCAVRPS